MGNYNNNNYNNGRSNNYNNRGNNLSHLNNGNGPKRSGCRIQHTTANRSTGEVKKDGDGNDVPTIFGWNKTRRNGLMSFVAIPRKGKGRQVKSRQTGKVKPNMEAWVATITIPGQADVTTSCFWNKAKQLLTFPNFNGGMVATLRGSGQTASGKTATGAWFTISAMKRK